MTQSRSTAISAAIVAGVAVAAMLYVGRVVFVPMALALLLASVLGPLVARMEKARIPAPAGAALLLLGILALFTAAGLALSGPAQDWARKAPQAAAAAAKKVQSLRHRFDRLSSLLVPRQAAQAPADSSHVPVQTDSAQATATAEQPAPSSAPSSSGSSMNAFLVRAFGTTTEIISSVISTVLLLFFLLAGGRAWRERIQKAASSAASGKRALGILQEIQRVTSRYMLLTLLINIGQGILVAIAMALVGMPAPPLWGLLTLVAEFVPYAGGLVMVVLLGLVGLAGSDNLGHVLLAPGCYLLITTLQNNLVSPFVYGENLRLNPVAILMSVIVWFFLWGVPGAFLAVPILAAFKILCDRVESLQPMGVFLEQ